MKLAIRSLNASLGVLFSCARLLQPNELHCDRYTSNGPEPYMQGGANAAMATSALMALR